MNLAFYGTLRDPDILQFVTGDAPPGRYYKSLSALGWACLRIEGEAYPLLRSDSNARTVFHLYHDCSEVSWRRLVAYEGCEYSHIEIEFEGNVYRVFMAEAQVTESRELWDLKTFQERDKRHYMDELRAHSF